MKKRNNLPLNIREKSNSRISFAVSIITLVALVIFFQRLDYNLIRKPARIAAETAAEKKKAEEIAANTPKIDSVSFIAVGDNLYHTALYESGYRDSGDWNYDHIYEFVKDEIQAADIAMIDQETVLTSNHSQVSSYPSFATPTEVGDAIIKAGFDVVESATNHIDDYGYDLMQETFDFWKTKYPDIPVLGIHETLEDSNTVKTLTVNNITFAFLDFTYGTNNGGAGEGREYMIDFFDTAKVSSMIQKAKEVSDCIIFVAHWGTEDETYPNEYEKEWAVFLMKQGVDVVIGGHPHVLQPYGRMTDDEGHEMVIFYSLGNFVSTQQELPELLGGMAKFTVQKTELQGETTIKVLDPWIDPTVMHYNRDEGYFRAYMLKDYTDALAENHSVRNLIGSTFTVANLKKQFEDTMNMNVKPSEKTYLLDVKFTWDGTMVDKKTGDYIEDYDSMSAWQIQSGDTGYYGEDDYDDSNNYDYDQDYDYDEEYE